MVGRLLRASLCLFLIPAMTKIASAYFFFNGGKITAALFLLNCSVSTLLFADQAVKKIKCQSSVKTPEQYLAFSTLAPFTTDHAMYRESILYGRP